MYVRRAPSSAARELLQPGNIGGAVASAWSSSSVTTSHEADSSALLHASKAGISSLRKKRTDAEEVEGLLSLGGL